MEEKRPSKFKSALNFGAILGLILMAISLIIYVFNIYESTDSISWISIVVLIAGIVIGIKKYRDQENGGYITYGSALGYGTLIALFAGIITAFFTYIYLGFIDDSFIQFKLMEAEDQMYASGTPDEQIEMALEWTKKFMRPGFLAISGVFMNAFLGFIISLIAAAFLKKEPENFDQAA